MRTFVDFLESKKVESGVKKYSYSSVLYLLPDKLSDRIYEWGLKNVKDEYLYKDPDDPGFGREDEIHCTVMYGIHNKTPKSVKVLMSEVEPFEIKLGKITAFTTSEKFDVLKIEVFGKKLHNLHNLIRDNIEVTEKYPEYNPHVTIAYLKKGKAKPFIDDDTFEGETMLVDKVVFSSSLGVKTPIKIKS